MRLTAAILSLSLGSPAAAEAPPAPDAEAPPGRDAAAAASLHARADALRKGGDYQAALAAYRAEIARLESARGWKGVGYTLRAMRRPRAAAEAFRRAIALDPNDREARDDLADLERSRGLEVRLWLGGTEPGTERNALDAVLSYGGLDRFELLGGYGWSDQRYYYSHKGFASAYWFYAADSSLMIDFTYRRYVYSGSLTPNPDTTSYDTVPRGTLELSHWFGRVFRAALGYQLFAPNFVHDTSTRILNHKLYGELTLAIGPLQVGAVAALFRDPDPRRTIVSQGAPPTRVVYRDELLVGGFAAFEARHWGAEVRYIPNRDLDASYAWSALSTLDLRPIDAWSLRLQWVFDKYSSVASFPGDTATILMGQVRWEATRWLALGAGLKYVETPLRTGPTVLASLDFRTGLF